MVKLKECFTRWYYRKGYRMYYENCDYGDLVASMSFECPWWIMPLLIFFSPSIYFIEYQKEIGRWYEEGIKQGMKEKGDYL